MLEKSIAFSGLYLSRSPPPHGQRVETTHLGTQEASEVDQTLYRSVVVGTEPVDQRLPTIRPVTEQEDVDLRTGSIRRYPKPPSLVEEGRTMEP